MYIFIVNKVAGGGRGIKVYNQLKRTKLYKNNDCRPLFTQFQGHAEQLAENTAQKYGNAITSLIIIGGDGTVHEVMNGLKNYKQIPLSFIPAGSGNDFARGYQMQGKPIEIFHRIIVNKQPTQLWSGCYSKDYIDDNSSDRLFANSIGFGFDAEIVKVANQSRYKYWLNKVHLGSLSYICALLQVLRTFKPKKVQLTIDGKQHDLKDVWMITIANHPFYGGGMKIIPGAKIQPKTIPLLIIRKIPVWKVLLFFLTVFWGKHISFKEVSIIEATSVFINSDKHIDYQVDGQPGTCTSCYISKENSARKVLGSVQ